MRLLFYILPSFLLRNYISFLIKMRLDNWLIRGTSEESGAEREEAIAI